MGPRGACRIGAGLLGIDGPPGAPGSSQLSKDFVRKSDAAICLPPQDRSCAGGIALVGFCSCGPSTVFHDLVGFWWLKSRNRMNNLELREFFGTCGVRHI